MLNLNFFDILNKFTCIPPNIQYYFCDLIPESKEIDVDLLWHKITERFYSLYPYFKTDILDSLKHEILMSIYTSARFAITKEISNPDIVKAVIQSYSAPNYAPDSTASIHTGLSIIKKDLKNIERIHLAAQYFDTSTLQYFSPFWQKDRFKVFSAFDFYSYIKEYKHWPCHPDNRYGIPLTELLDSYQRIFDGIFKPTQSTDMFEENFSAYIFEELFHPFALTDFIITFFDNFSDLFYSTKGEKNIVSREYVLYLLATFFNLPRSVRDGSKEYLDALKAHAQEIDSSDKERSYNKQLSSIIFNSFFLVPLLQAICCKSLYSVINQDLKSLEELLRNYLMNTNFNYRIDISNNFSRTKELYYPQQPKKGEPVTSSNIPVWNYNKSNRQAGRNNTTIDTFEINMTYYLFHYPLLLSIPEQILYQKLLWNPPAQLEIILKYIFDCEPECNCPAKKTFNYQKYTTEDYKI